MSHTLSCSTYLTERTSPVCWFDPWSFCMKFVCCPHCQTLTYGGPVVQTNITKCKAL